jgi:hypothetical protein
VRTPALDENNRAHVFGVVGRTAVGSAAAAAEAVLERTGGPEAAEPHGAVLVPYRDRFVRDAHGQLAVRSEPIDSTHPAGVPTMRKNPTQRFQGVGRV